MKQTINAQINFTNILTKDDTVIAVFDLVKVGVISFPIHSYENIVKFLQIFPEGFHKEKYIRLLIEDNKVIGIGHITEDLIFMIPVVEEVPSDIEE